MSSEPLFRQRLHHKLQHALSGDHLLIAAPPGYGKTVLLQQAAAVRPHSYYFLLTADDRDTAVLQHRLRPRQQPGHTLLLDDIHLLAESEIATAWLADQLSQTDWRYVLSGRFIPEQLVTALAKGQAVRWEEAELLFAPEESQALLAGSDGPHEDWASWHAQLEGWPLGLGLLARLPDARQARKLARQQLFIYLAQELFEHLPVELYQFMRLTAVPLQFTDALAAHLLNSPDTSHLRQEIQRHNLFLYENEQPGHFRYHDLIRDYLLAQEDEQQGHWQKTIAWFEAQGDLPQAIEHALAAGWPEEAARLINLVSPDYIYESDRYLTYKRWGEALSDEVRRRYPRILYNLGDFLFFLDDYQTAARRYMAEALAAAASQGDRRLTLMARWRLVYFELDADEATEAALAELELLSREPEVALFASQTYAMALADQGRFFQAAGVLRQAIFLADSQGEWERVWRMRAFMALIALLPMGRFAQAAAHFNGALAYFANEPGRQYVTRQNNNELHFASANWAALTDNLAEIDALERQLEIPAVYNLTWISYYRGLWAAGLGDFPAANEHLDAMQGSFNPGDRRCEIPLARARSWTLRRQGELAQAVALAAAELAQPPVFPHYRALLALEHDIAAAFLFLDGERPAFTLLPDTTALMQMRTRPDLARLRALLALVCYHRGDGRWRRHFQAALYALKLPYHERLLTDRDPELGGRFWQLAVITGLAVAQAGAALRRLNQPELLYPLLAHKQTAVRQRAGRILGEMGSEAAMPHLSQAIEREKDKGMKAGLTAVLAHLESLPPPSLHVQLMGDFRLTRDGRVIPDSDWPRPVTRRLAQYFALHWGVPLPRDQILDDLWPDLPPDKAWSNFRTIYSQLRRVVEPYMRPKAESRYFSLEGERYLFDPGGYVTVDMVEFEAAVRQTIASAANHPLPPLPDELLHSLENWQPLLPELAYEEWLLAARERLETTYIEGCLYVARGLLSYGRPAKAVVWARRAVAKAPWLEEGYRALMRAYARQDKRSLALKTYEEAARALQQELNVEPSAMTQWLVTRLQNNEEI
jgi:DNA-binding SARP family transcriptional activator/DNA polymerase III delta prime subunit